MRSPFRPLGEVAPKVLKDIEHNREVEERLTTCRKCGGKRVEVMCITCGGDGRSYENEGNDLTPYTSCKPCGGYGNWFACSSCDDGATPPQGDGESS